MLNSIQHYKNDFQNMSYNQPKFTNTPKLNYRLPKLTLKSIKQTSTIDQYFENQKRESLLIQSSMIEKELINQIHSQNQQKKKIQIANPDSKAQFLQVKILPQRNINLYYRFNPSNWSQTSSKVVSGDLSETDNRQMSKSLIHKSLNSSNQQEQLNIASSRSLNHDKVSSSRSIDNFREQSFDQQIEIPENDNQMNKQKYFNFLQNNFSLPYKKVMEEYIRLQRRLNYFRLWGLIIIFIRRLKMTTKINYLRVLKKLKDIKRDLFVSRDSNELQDIKNSWSEFVIDKVKIFLNSHKFTSPFKNNKNFSQAKFQQLKNQLTITMATKLFLSLLEMIKQEFFPKEILKLSQLHILLIMKNCPLFIANRISSKLLQPEQTLIMCHFVIFELLINTLIQSSNNLQCLNEKHLIECKFQIITLCTLLQLLFMNHFRKMKLHQGQSVQIGQRRLVIQGKKHHLQIIEDKEIDTTEVIITGLQNLDYLKNLIKSEWPWYKELLKLFENFVKELESQNQI